MKLTIKTKEVTFELEKEYEEGLDKLKELITKVVEESIKIKVL